MRQLEVAAHRDTGDRHRIVGVISHANEVLSTRDTHRLVPKVELRRREAKWILRIADERDDLWTSYPRVKD